MSCSPCESSPRVHLYEDITRAEDQRLGLRRLRCRRCWTEVECTDPETPDPPPDPAGPTLLAAGSDAKIDLMRRRVEQGFSCFHPSDNPATGSWRRVRTRADAGRGKGVYKVKNKWRAVIRIDLGLFATEAEALAAVAAYRQDAA